MKQISSDKLQKVLAMHGLGSRRLMEAWIAEGRVSVNGKTADIGCRVDEKAVITVDGKPLPARIFQQDPQLLMYHKPIGEVCTRHDPEHRPTVFERLPRLARGRWVAVGRLDVNTSGLLLFTDSGDWANQLMHPSFHLVREYKVRVSGRITPAVLGALTKGVMLEDGMARFNEIIPITAADRQNRWFRVSISQGRHRVVRRLLASQHLTITRLSRIRFGTLEMPEALKPGAYQFVSLRDVTGKRG